jgi:hypothetical protein
MPGVATSALRMAATRLRCWLKRLPTCACWPAWAPTAASALSAPSAAGSSRSSRMSSSDYRLIGLAYEWEFETSCWVISNLSEVTTTYRQEFIAFYDELFAAWPAEFESYYIRSDEMREVFITRRRRIPLLHRNGHDYLVSPFSERMQRVPPERFQKFGPYRPARA